MNGARPANFPTTSWSLVIAAAANPTDDSRASLATLCRIYWQPIYAFVRRKGYDTDQAQDLTQAFFTAMLEKNYLGDADRERGRFRAFLLAAVKHFLANEWDRAHALKRGGDRVAVPIDPIEAEAWYVPEAVEARTPESFFERRWALSVLEQVMAKLRTEWAGMGKREYFDKLSPWLDGDPEANRYDALAAALGGTPGALRTAVHRMRRRYRELLRAEIAETVASAAEIDDEIRFLLSALRS
ncbi:MAG: RNA polymerase subunit sigma-24 [Terriglobia bacterium]|nr:MAG: RNA polymerase subunit sigma-24 [Terriglobia bacterium]